MRSKKCHISGDASNSYADCAVVSIWLSPPSQPAAALRRLLLLFPEKYIPPIRLWHFYFIFLLEMIGEVPCILPHLGETNNTIYNESHPSQAWLIGPTQPAEIMADFLYKTHHTVAGDVSHHLDLGFTLTKPGL